MCSINDTHFAIMCRINRRVTEFIDYSLPKHPIINIIISSRAFETFKFSEMCIHEARDVYNTSFLDLLWGGGNKRSDKN